MRTDLFGATFVKRSDVMAGGICSYMCPRTCGRPAEYACTIKEFSRQHFMCGGETLVPYGLCKEHAIIHAKVHGIYSSKLDQQVRIFAVVVE